MCAWAKVTGLVGIFLLPITSLSIALAVFGRITTLFGAFLTHYPSFQFLKKFARYFVIVLLGGLLIPQRMVMPVRGATSADYNVKSFWFYPWGRSVTHKGVDIFAKSGTQIVAATGGWVIYRGEVELGGKVVLVLGPKWRLHYYAHLDQITASAGWSGQASPPALLHRYFAALSLAH